MVFDVESVLLTFALVVTLGIGIFTLQALRRQRQMTAFFANHPELFPYDVLRIFEQDIGAILATHQLISYATYIQMALVGSLFWADKTYIYALLLSVVWLWYLSPRIYDEMRVWQDETEHELELHRKTVAGRSRPKHLRLISRN